MIRCWQCSAPTRKKMINPFFFFGMEQNNLEELSRLCKSCSKEVVQRERILCSKCRFFTCQNDFVIDIGAKIYCHYGRRNHHNHHNRHNRHNRNFLLFDNPQSNYQRSPACEYCGLTLCYDCKQQPQQLFEQINVQRNDCCFHYESTLNWQKQLLFHFYLLLASPFTSYVSLFVFTKNRMDLKFSFSNILYFIGFYVIFIHGMYPFYLIWQVKCCLSRISDDIYNLYMTYK